MLLHSEQHGEERREQDPTADAQESRSSSGDESDQTGNNPLRHGCVPRYLKRCDDDWKRDDKLNRAL